MNGPRLLLIGGGHAHVFVCEAVARGRVPAAQVTLVSPHDRQVYSGMVPGLIGGRYTLEEVSFDLPVIAARCGIRFVRDSAVRLDPVARTVALASGEILPYDVVSFAIGGAPAGSDRPGVAEHAHFVKPINRVLELLPAIDHAAAARGPEPLQVLVAGAGAAGVEIALALRARLDRLGATRAVITLYDTSHTLLRDRHPAARAHAERALRRGEITLRLGTGIEEVGPSHARLSGGRVVPADLVVWTAGTRAPSLFRESGLPTDPRGFLLVEETLQASGVPEVFAAGDAATLVTAPQTPKAGVYAVRQAPVLVHNLRAALRDVARARPAGGRGNQLRPYRPQPRFLALLNTGDGRAVLSYGEVALTGRWAMRLKDWIDRGFMRRFQRLAAAR